MPAVRLVRFQGADYRLSDLARQHGILPQTLAARLDRGTPVEVAVNMRILTRSQSGRRGYCASHWRED